MQGAHREPPNMEQRAANIAGKEAKSAPRYGRKDHAMTEWRTIVVQRFDQFTSSGRPRHRDRQSRRGGETHEVQFRLELTASPVEFGRHPKKESRPACSKLIDRVRANPYLNESVGLSMP